MHIIKHAVFCDSRSPQHFSLRFSHRPELPRWQRWHSNAYEPTHRHFETNIKYLDNFASHRSDFSKTSLASEYRPETCNNIIKHLVDFVKTNWYQEMRDWMLLIAFTLDNISNVEVIKTLSALDSRVLGRKYFHVLEFLLDDIGARLMFLFGLCCINVRLYKERKIIDNNKNWNKKLVWTQLSSLPASLRDAGSGYVTLLLENVVYVQSGVDGPIWVHGEK